MMLIYKMAKRGMFVKLLGLKNGERKEVDGRICLGTIILPLKKGCLSNV